MLKLGNFDVAAFDTQAAIHEPRVTGHMIRWPANYDDGRETTVLVNSIAVEEMVDRVFPGREDPERKKGISELERDAMMRYRSLIEQAAKRKAPSDDGIIRLFREDIGPLA